MNSSERYIGKDVIVIIDRPLGSIHPKWDFQYQVNYGYLPDTISGDGEELDAYILGVEIPLESFAGRCIAVMRRLEENDDKLIVVPHGVTISHKEIKNQTHFQEQWFTIEII